LWECWRNKGTIHFEALKLVVQKNLQVYELQLQTVAMLEREIVGFRENHHTRPIKKQLRRCTMSQDEEDTPQNEEHMQNEEKG